MVPASGRSDFFSGGEVRGAGEEKQSNAQVDAGSIPATHACFPRWRMAACRHLPPATPSAEFPFLVSLPETEHSSFTFVPRGNQH